MPNMWQYESFTLQDKSGSGAPSHEDIRETLNRFGKIGYQVLHIKERADASLTFILARDTGRPIDEGEDQREDWLVDVVTGAETHLAAGFGE